MQSCECPKTSQVPPERMVLYAEEERDGTNHEPGQCRGTFRIRPYRRGETVLLLCSCCTFFSDVEVTESLANAHT